MSVSFREVVAHHSEALFAQVICTVACNVKHAMEARLCRWLLMVHDRVDGDTLDLTHEFLSQMVGTRRASITVAAQTLQMAGLIKYQHGHITIVDREGLEEVACECYSIDRKHFDRLMALRPAE